MSWTAWLALGLYLVGMPVMASSEHMAHRQGKLVLCFWPLLGTFMFIVLIFTIPTGWLIKWVAKKEGTTVRELMEKMLKH